jgi:glyoxylase-like metal-dependent hydrolase (beta-lactamase superfamily II)
MSAESLNISRRRFIASAGLAATAVCLVPHRVFGGEESLVVVSRKAGETVNVTVQTLRRNVSALIGSGGNIAVLPGGDGKLMIDSGFLGTRSKIAAALSSLSPDPIKHLVNTHWHFDHTDGNEWMHSAGATITAHENTRKHLSTSTQWKIGTSLSRHRRQARFRPTYSTPKRRSTSMALPLRSNITVRVTPTAISRLILLKLMSSTPATLGGTDTTHSSIIRLAEASME